MYLQVETGSTCAVFGLGALGLAVINGCKAAGTTRIIGIDFKVTKEFGLFLRVYGQRGDHGEEVDSTFTDHPSRAALKACHKDWGTSVTIGVAAGGQKISTPPFQLVTGRTWPRTGMGYTSVEGVPKLVSEYMNKKLKVDEFVTHTLPFEKIRGLQYNACWEM
ncbi:unnamed protein product, partial [Coregonus sp. 'balchen']